MTSKESGFRVEVDAGGFQPNAWAWSIYQTRDKVPFMRSTLTFPNRAAATRAGKHALATLHLERRRAAALARLS